ncbi:hypothetical protein [Perlucidibaca piscinae]|uniref:hypothetical protein n=1 Tax=Perlucidibaca piscinae TaxID=392589 RepID=UPI0003B2E257|nr:hypothetical protein [Perlucidibaca piscinae]
MLITKIAKLSAAGMLAVALAACSADGDSDTNTNTGGPGGPGLPTVEQARELCSDLELSGTISSVQETLCDALANTPLDPANVVVAQLLLDSPLEDIIRQLDALLDQGGGLEAVDALLSQLVGENAALQPVVDGLNSVLVALLADQDPAAILDLLGGLGDFGGLDDPTGGQLLGLLGSGDNPITSLLGALTGNTGGSDPLTGLLAGLSGNLNTGTNPGGSAGLITVVQDNVLADLLGDTELAVVNDLLGELVDPTSGVLAPLTSQLDNLTGTESPLGVLTELVDQVNTGVLEPVGEALQPVLDGVGSLLGGLLGGSNPLGGLLG